MSDLKPPFRILNLSSHSPCSLVGGGARQDASGGGAGAGDCWLEWGAEGDSGDGLFQVGSEWVTMLGRRFDTLGKRVGKVTNSVDHSSAYSTLSLAKFGIEMREKGLPWFCAYCIFCREHLWPV